MGLTIWYCWSFLAIWYYLFYSTLSTHGFAQSYQVLLIFPIPIISLPCQRIFLSQNIIHRPHHFWSILARLSSISAILWSMSAQLRSLPAHLRSISAIFWSISAHLRSISAIFWSISAHLRSLSTHLWSISAHLQLLAKIIS